MISVTLAHQLQEQIAAEIAVEAITNDQMVVYMPFVFDDGDRCSIYLSRLDEAQWKLTDHGDVIKRASYAGVDLLNANHAERFRTIASFYGVAENEGALDLVTDQEGLSDAVFAMTQTCMEATWLAKMPLFNRTLSESKKFPQRLTTLVEKAVPRHRITHNWHDPVADPHGVYRVDHRIEGREKQLLLFGIGGPNSCMRATIACLYYKKEGLDFEGIAIYRNEEKLEKRYTEPLNDAVDKRFPRIAESKSITRYIAAAAA
jgi:hypothetical protein